MLPLLACVLALTPSPCLAALNLLFVCGVLTEALRLLLFQAAEEYDLTAELDEELEGVLADLLSLSLPL